MRYLVLPVLLSLPLTAYAGNIKDTDLITSNTFFLPPKHAEDRLHSSPQFVRQSRRLASRSRVTADRKGVSGCPRSQRGALHRAGQHCLLQHHQTGNAGREYRRKWLWIGHSAPR